MMVSVPLVGQVAGDRADTIQHVTEGTPVWLVPQPDNPVDPHAIAVVVGGVQAGYVAAAVAARFALDGPTPGVAVRVRTVPGNRSRVAGFDVRADLRSRESVAA